MKRQFRLLVVCIIFVIIIFAIYYVKDKIYCGTNELYNALYSGIIGNVLAAFFAAFLVWVAWEQWSNLSVTSSADFIHKLTKDFFTKEARKLISLLDCKALIFVPPFELPDSEISLDGVKASQGYFQVDSDILNKAHLPVEIINDLTEKKYYSLWEIDDYLLSPLEDVGMLEKRGIVEFQMVYSGFSYYLESALGNNEIKKYINCMRQDNEATTADVMFYGDAQYISVKCKEFDDLHSGPCKWWWYAKRQLFNIEPSLDRELKIEN